MPDRPGYPRSRTMAAIRSTNTTPERRVRSALHARGVRYRLGQAIGTTTGRSIKPDLVFRSQRLAVFVDGCFWHGCGEHCRQPGSNTDYWQTKLARNVQRDRETDSRLDKAGWTVIRVWEHDDPTVAAARIAEALASVRSSGEV